MPSRARANNPTSQSAKPKTWPRSCGPNEVAEVCRPTTVRPAANGISETNADLEQEVHPGVGPRSSVTQAAEMPETPEKLSLGNALRPRPTTVIVDDDAPRTQNTATMGSLNHDHDHPDTHRDVVRWKR